MRRFLESLDQAVLGRSAEELVGALLLALLVSQLAAIVYRFGKRRMADTQLLMCVVVMVSSLASMALAAGYIVGVNAEAQTEDGPFNGYVFDGVPPTWPPMAPPVQHMTYDFNLWGWPGAPGVPLVESTPDRSPAAKFDPYFPVPEPGETEGSDADASEQPPHRFD